MELWSATGPLLSSSLKVSWQLLCRHTQEGLTLLSTLLCSAHRSDHISRRRWRKVRKMELMSTAFIFKVANAIWKRGISSRATPRCFSPKCLSFGTFVVIQVATSHYRELQANWHHFPVSPLQNIDQKGRVIDNGSLHQLRDVYGSEDQAGARALGASWSGDVVPRWLIVIF